MTKPLISNLSIRPWGTGLLASDEIRKALSDKIFRRFFRKQLKSLQAAAFDHLLPL